MQKLSKNKEIKMNYKKFKHLNWKEILWLKNNPSPPMTDRVDMRNFVHGFCAFVRSNWTDNARTYKEAFSFFKSDYLEEFVHVPDSLK